MTAQELQKSIDKQVECWKHCIWFYVGTATRNDGIVMFRPW